MSLKLELAENVVNQYAAALRDPAIKGADRAQRLQDLVEKALEKYGEIVAAGAAKRCKEHAA